MKFLNNHPSSTKFMKKIRSKIYETVNSGITNTTVIKRILKSFVEAEFRNKEIKPSVYDRAFYPLSKDIKNHVHKAIASGTLSALDQENLKKKIEEWRREKDCTGIFSFALPQRKWKTMLGTIFYLSIKKNGRGD